VCRSGLLSAVGPGTFEDLAVQTRNKRRPVRLANRVGLDRLSELVDLGVQIVEVVQDDRFGCHRQARAAVFVAAVVADDHVLDPQRRLLRELLAGHAFDLSDLLSDHFDADRHVAEQLAFVGVAERVLEAHLTDLAQVVQKDAREDEAEVDVRVQILDPQRDFQHVRNVLDQPAGVRVVCFDAGSGASHRRGQLVVDQEALHQRTDGRIGDAQQDLLHTEHQLFDVGFGLQLEILASDPVGIGLVDPRHDHLQPALVELDLAFDADEVTGLEGVARVLVDIPHQPADRPRPVPQLSEQVQVGIPVRPNLLLGQQKHLVHRIPILKFPDPLPRHEKLAFFDVKLPAEPDFCPLVRRVGMMEAPFQSSNLSDRDSPQNGQISPENAACLPADATLVGSSVTRSPVHFSFRRLKEWGGRGWTEPAKEAPELSNMTSPAPQQTPESLSTGKHRRPGLHSYLAPAPATRFRSSLFRPWQVLTIELQHSLFCI
jgi:hypothetical protein